MSQCSNDTSVCSISLYLFLCIQTIVEERDQERERRWKAEQAVRKLTEDMKCLQTKVSEEKDLQSMALHTTDRYVVVHRDAHVCTVHGAIALRQIQ